uniref:Uncharacterized protein n=1 Tax=candidate division CPR3 bacterium TaxID=2268181 RepID=A0A7V3N5B8_UNCC3
MDTFKVSEYLKSLLSPWLSGGFSEEDAKKWIALGFSLIEATKWAQIGATPSEADIWRRSGFSAVEEVACLVSLGLDSPDDIRRWVGYGFTIDEILVEKSLGRTPQQSWEIKNSGGK